MDLRIGNKVKYSAKWLRSTGTYTGPLPFARGHITEIRAFSKSGLATVKWDNDYDNEVPTKILCANLVLSKASEA